jgi:hypothetical protein
LKTINARTGILLLLLFPVVVGCLYREKLMMIAGHNLNVWRASSKIASALDGARSVAFVEFDGNGKTVRIDGKQEEIRQLRQATSRRLALSFPEGAMGFDPHHRVDIVRADGSQFHFVICFGSRNFALDSPETEVFDLPRRWRKSLMELFKSVGMKPFDADDVRPEGTK